MLTRPGNAKPIIDATQPLEKIPGITVGRLLGAHPIIMKKIIEVKTQIQHTTQLPRSLDIFHGRPVKSSHAITCEDVETLKTMTSQGVEETLDWLQVYYKQLTQFQKAIEGVGNVRDIQKELQDPKYTHLEYLDTGVLNKIIGQLPSLSFVLSLLELPAFAGVKFNAITLKKLLEKVHNTSHIETLFDIPQVKEMAFDTQTVNFLYKHAKSLAELDVIIGGVNPRKRRSANTPGFVHGAELETQTIAYNAQTILHIVEVVVKDEIFPVEHKEHRIIEAFGMVDPEKDFEGLDRGEILKNLFELIHMKGIHWESWFYTKVKKTALGKVLDEQIAIGKRK